MRNGDAPTRPILITADRVWDGVSAEPIRDGFVLSDGDKITAIGRSAELGTVAGPAWRIDLPGATVLPGLINAHVHIALSGGRSPVRDYLSEAAAGVAALTVRAVRNLGGGLAAGVTTVRDLGCPNEVAFELRAAVADGRITGPRVVTSGRPITVTGGHCHWFGWECDAAEDVRIAVRRQVRDGADWIKLILSGGNLTPRTNPLLPQFSRAEVLACAAEARRLNTPLAVHAYDPVSIGWAAACGARTIEHCVFETEDGIAYDPAIAGLMAERGIAFVPTISGAFHRLRATAAGDAPPLAERFLAKQHRIREVFRKLRAAGVPLIAGSDAGVPGREFGGFPADLAALVGTEGIGLSPREALVSATSGAASALGLGDTGVLAPGRRADVLAVHGDPLRDIADIAEPRFVLAGGEPVRTPPTDARVRSNA